MKRNPKLPLRAPLAVVVQHEQSMRFPSDVWTHIVIMDPSQITPPSADLRYFHRLAPAAVAYLVTEPELAPGERRVARSVSRKGYGPTLYEVALNIAHEGGWKLKPGTELSSSARTVWKRFGERRDVDAEPVMEPDHEDPDLQYGYSLEREPTGLGAAMSRGAQLVERLYVEEGFAQPVALRALMGAGNRMWLNRMEAERMGRTG